MLIRRRTLFIINKNILPSEYQQIKYVTIQNDSSNGYRNRINTQLKWSSTSYSYIFDITVHAPRSNTHYMFISSSSSTGDGSVSDPWIGSGDTGQGSGSGGVVWNTSYTTVSNITDDLYPSELLSTSVVGHANFTAKALSYTSYYITFGSWSESGWSTTLDWYNFKISAANSSTWAVNYYPCYRKSDNKVGFYDIVRNRFDTNVSSGTLIAGPNYVGSL